MRHLIIIIAGFGLVGCTKVNFAPSAPQTLDKASFAVVCDTGEMKWVASDSSLVACPDVCSDGTVLACPQPNEKQMICLDQAWQETGRTRLGTIGAPINSCPVASTPAPAPAPVPAPPANPPVVVTPPVDPPVAVPPVVVPPVSTKPVHEQFATNGPGKADILLVLDTTDSMDSKLDKIAQKLASLTTKLAGVDWQIAVTNAGSGREWPNYGHAYGKFFEFQGDAQHRRVLTSQTPDIDRLLTLTIGRAGDPLTSDGYCTVQPYCMDRSPEPIASLVQSMKLKDTVNKGFFRPDAYLVPLLVSDADENEDGTNVQFTPAQAVEQYSKTIGAAMKGMVGFGVVVKPGDVACYNQVYNNLLGAHYGTQVDAFANLTGGLTISLCDADYGPGLAQIGDRLRDRIASYDLASDPVDGKVNVTVAPAVAGLTWTVSGRHVTFSSVLPANSAVSFDYDTAGN